MLSISPNPHKYTHQTHWVQPRALLSDPICVLHKSWRPVQLTQHPIMDSSRSTSKHRGQWEKAVLCFNIFILFWFDHFLLSFLFSWALLASFSHRLTQIAPHSLHHTSKVESYCSAIMNHCHTLLPLDCHWLSRTLKIFFLWLESQNQRLKFVFCSKSVFEWWERWRKQPRVLFWGFWPFLWLCQGIMWHSTAVKGCSITRFMCTFQICFW